MKSWMLLLAALVCGALVVTLMLMPQLPLPSATFDVAMALAAVLQAAGVFVMVRALRARSVGGGWPMVVGYLAALLWVVAYGAAWLGVSAGAGGLVYGILLLLPAIWLGFATQIVALLGFARRAKA